MKFKIGDKVRLTEAGIDRLDGAHNLDFTEGEIVFDTHRGYYVVEFKNGYVLDTKTSEIELIKNDGKLRFTYSEVPSGTEYSNFLNWSKDYK